ncbi:MAG: hypothetical protein ACI9CV_000430 [Ilumatobacter sp.]|jgi:hypothetical protein
MWIESEHFAVRYGLMGTPPRAPTSTRIIVELTDLDGAPEMVMPREGLSGESPARRVGTWLSASSKPVLPNSQAKILE